MELDKTLNIMKMFAIDTEERKKQAKTEQTPSPSLLLRFKKGSLRLSARLDLKDPEIETFWAEYHAICKARMSNLKKKVRKGKKDDAP